MKSKTDEFDPQAVIRADSKRQQIKDTVLRLNEDELEVVLLVAQGLRVGRKAYGPMDIATDTRDAKVEAIQELRDCLVYVNMAVLKLIQG